MRPPRLKFRLLSRRHGGHASPSLNRLCCRSSCCQFERCLPPNIIGFSRTASPGTTGVGEVSTAHLERRGAGLHKTRSFACLQAIPWHSKEGVGFTDNTRVERQQSGLLCCPLAQDLSHGCRRRWRPALRFKRV